MDNPARAATNRDFVNEEVARLRHSNFRSLSFLRPLEEQFERDTAKERSYRLWLEGLLAILVLNGCLLVDYLVVKDVMFESVVKRTEIVTPLALLVNYMMRLNLTRWAREGSVAVGMTLICFINVYVEGSGSAATGIFELMAVMITVLFVNVVMRLRFPYAATSTLLMLASGLWAAYHTSGLMASGKTVGASMMTLGVAMTLTAGYSLERQERLSYLLFLSSELQSAELHRLSNIDKLTGLPNRRAFEERFERLWREGVEARTPLSAIVIDIDHFKVVNDVYGHLYGDEVLRRVAGLLPQALRAQDDMAARFGGEEFVILLPDTSLVTAVVVADRVRKLVEMAGTPVPGQSAGDQTLWATVSCGVSACVPEAGLTSERLLKVADRALYKAKANGRNRVEFRRCDPSSSVHRSIAGRSQSSQSSQSRRSMAKAAKRDSGSHSGAKMG
jgi:diguanylate cyclase (GGDEF)-like protein